ncbi:cytochrome P450 [Mycena vulgaris]|nr:cytochrome P450 [Mycena vulgaris]
MNYTLGYAVLVSALALIFNRVRRRESVVWRIVGPPSPGWIFGNLLQLFLSESYGDYEFNWLKLYGPIYRIKGCFGQDRLMVSDPAAMQHILNSPHFVYAPVMQHISNLMFGEKSLAGGQTSAEDHRVLRAGLNPGFTAAAVRDYHSVFEKEADMITEKLESSSATSMDICPLLDIATLGAVSEAVLGSSTEDLGNDFVMHHNQIMTIASTRSAAQIFIASVGAYLPMWLLGAMIHLPTAAFKILRQARLNAHRIGAQIVREKMEAASHGLEINNDVYSLLLQDKTAKALKPDQIVEQTAEFILAGQDTTSNTLAFALLELARNREFQDELRTEIHANVGAGHHKIVYDGMPLLNALIKETLRMYPAEALTDRIALRDMVIPLTESITTTNGERMTQMPVCKGQIVTVAIASYQRLESRWGERPHEFRPSRWLAGETYQGEAVGPYANLLSFLGGHHTCIGWRFAILQMQVILCEIVGKFSLDLPENDPVRARIVNLLIPTVGSGEKGVPLRITRIL